MRKRTKSGLRNWNSWEGEREKGEEMGEESGNGSKRNREGEGMGEAKWY